MGYSCTKVGEFGPAFASQLALYLPDYNAVGGYVWFGGKKLCCAPNSVRGSLFARIRMAYDGI